MQQRTRAAAVMAALLSYLWSSVPAAAETVAVAAPARAASPTTCAPADEYFGPLRLSVLGMSNNLSETERRVDGGGTDAGSTLAHLALIEASLRAWEAKYPRDAWLPRMLLALHRVYRHVATEEAALRSVDAASWLLRGYARSDEARTLRAELAGAIRSQPAVPPEDAAVAVPAAVAAEQ